MRYHALRPLLFRLDPESAHHRTLQLLALAGFSGVGRALLRRLFAYADPCLETEVFGLRFPNPVGLAAGYDKDGVALGGLAALGFGHLEAGTVTLAPQPGNPKPRVFREPESSALINSLGFPSQGAAAVLPRLQAARPTLGRAVLGVNLGKNKTTPLEQAAADYAQLVQRLGLAADYITINISSPNTAGLRDLQHRVYLEPLLRAVLAERDAHAPGCPLLVKIAPDLTLAEVDEVLDVALAVGVAGLIATNSLQSLPPRRPGGLTGPPLRARSTEIVRHLYRQTQGRLPLIAVGGIHDSAAALEKLQAGAGLVQLYTGLIYEGPALVGRLNRDLAAWLKQQGLTHISQAVGAAA
ncbi:MAG: quinone-dependent dihydroorotate dehydrogenase [Anaerolineales bacterium]|nr:quinone-dependent dihydroorotate dehydrogenase [Anaerolineales bacterium]